MSALQILFAHGAGAGVDSPWMLRWRRQLESLGRVTPLEYRYKQEGKKLPSRLPVLVSEHLAQIDRVQDEFPSAPLVLAGKSMGGRVGCHAALSRSVAGLICFGYPLYGIGKSRAKRDEVLRQLTVPVLFLQGTRDRLCPIKDLEKVRKEMHARSSLHIVEGGDHSLQVRKRDSLSQPEVEQQCLEAIEEFIRARATCVPE